MAELNCIVVTPENTALEQTTSFVVVPLFDGELGIAPGHSPMIGRLGFGEMRLRRDGRTMHYYVDGGFVQISGNTVTVLTNRAIPAGDVDAAAARQQLESAGKGPAHSSELLDIRDRSVQQAWAQLRVAKRGQ
jgi:F-type H+-transporting ATPase subunit epsilon